MIVSGPPNLLLIMTAQLKRLQGKRILSITYFFSYSYYIFNIVKIAIIGRILNVVKNKEYL